MTAKLETLPRDDARRMTDVLMRNMSHALDLRQFGTVATQARLMNRLAVGLSKTSDKLVTVNLNGPDEKALFAVLQDQQQGEPLIG